MLGRGLMMLAATSLSTAAVALVVASPAAASSPTPTCAASAAGRHTVVAGDSWFVLSQRLGVDMSALLDANGASDETVIRPGEVLCLPAGAVTTATPPQRTGCASSYTVVEGDSWFHVALRTGTTLAAMLDGNGATEDTVIRPGDVICLPAGAVAPAAAPASAPAPTAPSCASSYTVVPDDSWFAISLAVGVEMRALLDANAATASTIIRAGDELCLPAGATAPAPTRACAKTAATYTVIVDDSWAWIAKKHSTTMTSLLDANRATVATMLQPGDELCVPADAGAPAATGSGVLKAFPVEAPCWFSDTWHAARGGGRLHEGVDILAARGQYLYAVVDGTLTKRAWDQPGRRAGNAWWLTTADGTYYFYAHMLDFNPGLKVGSRVRAGDIIGFVGATGNAAGSHLHFEVHPKGGAPINPYPIVKAMDGCRVDGP